VPLCYSTELDPGRYTVTAAELSVISQTETLSQSKTPKVTYSEQEKKAEGKENLKQS
jgi:hypothetical protein